MSRPTLAHAIVVAALMALGASVPGLLQVRAAAPRAQESAFGAIDIAPGGVT